MLNEIPIISRSIDDHPELPLDPDAAQPGFYKWPPRLLPSLQLLVFIGGGLGILAHYGISSLIPTVGDGWPLATLFINLMGAFLLGLLLESLASRGPDQGILRQIRLGVGTGFLGAFTTYSAFAIEVVVLYKNGQYMTAFLYALISLIAGLACSALGIFIASNYHKTKAETTL